MPGQMVSQAGLMALKENLEQNELKGLENQLTCDMCLQLLALKLYFNEMVDAKFLWKRIQPRHKEANPELGKLWQVGAAMWNRNFPEIHELLDSTAWSEPITQIISLLKEQVRERTLRLVSKAYSSINLKDLSQMLNLPSTKVTEIVMGRSWSVDATGMVSPKCLPEEDSLGSGKDSVDLASLTHLVSYLEN